MEISISGIYIAGDIAGIEEVSIAIEEERIAGVATTESLGYIMPDKARMIQNRAEK